MTKSQPCLSCLWEEETGKVIDRSRSNVAWANKIGVSEGSIRRHLKHGESTAQEAGPLGESEKNESESHDPKSGSSYVRFSKVPWGYTDFCDFIRSVGQNPDEVSFTWGWTSKPGGGFWNKLNNVRPIVTPAAELGPEWPVIQQAKPVAIKIQTPISKPARGGLRLSLKCADPQIGYRSIPGRELAPFHDDRAMALFVEIVRREQPESVIILGDFLDLPSQGRFAQEASFAQTTQPALDAGYLFLASLRASAPDAQIILVEGNHDKRMQNFVETNALAAFGLKRADMPDSWPVMSLPYLLRLDELGVEYVDAYPAATHWDNDATRNIHGTRANSKGSTMSQYAAELPHINTWAGHTHRAEIVYKTTMGHRGEPIESYAANPGCLCLTDGSVPSVHGAISSDGTPAKIVEDWQQGFGALLYSETESWPSVYRIKNGQTIYNGNVVTIDG